jgi:uncharacterized protein YndB with AHSA1/START domain
MRAPRAAIYRALVDPAAVARWMVPEGMTSQVHAFEAHVGGAFRISLTYEAAGSQGKSSAHTDTYHGRFVELVPDERVVQTMEFETADAAMRGEMTVTFTLRDEDGGTEVVGLHEGVPPGVAAEDNEQGWGMAFDKLAALVSASS